jgi:hypothetical protein
LETAQGPLGGAAWAQKEKKATLETAPNNAIVIARVDAAGMCVSLPFFGYGTTRQKRLSKARSWALRHRVRRTRATLKFLRRLEPVVEPLAPRQCGGNSLRKNLFFRRRTGEIGGVAMLSLS